MTFGAAHDRDHASYAVLAAIDPVDGRKGIGRLISGLSLGTQSHPMNGTIFAFRNRSHRSINC